MKIFFFNTALISLLAITTSFVVAGKDHLLTDKIDSKNALQLITPAKVNLAGEQVTKKETTHLGKKNKEDRFTPTEAISEDLAVSFPVDI